MKVLIRCLILIVILIGCQSNDCFDSCVATYKNTKIEYIKTSCSFWDTVCITEPTQDLKEYCFNRCFNQTQNE